MIAVVFARPDDPRIVPVIETHVRSMDASTADPEACHRLDLSGLLAPHITFFGAFDDTDPGAAAIGIGAYAHFADWGEVKSMHVLAAHRGRGISRLLLQAIETVARERGAGVLRLETGADFDAAIGLYRASGFEPCGAFGTYRDHPFSRFFEKRL